MRRHTTSSRPIATHAATALCVLLSSVVAATALLCVAGCDEDRAPPVTNATPSGVNPDGTPANTKPTAKGDVGQGHTGRKSAYGKAVDVAEDLVHKKVPDYNKKIEEEIPKR